jgi:hypothetical protein
LTLRRTLLIAVSMLAAITYSTSAPEAQSSTETTTTTTTTTTQLEVHRAAVHLWRGRVRRRRIIAVRRAHRLGIRLHPGAVERTTDRVRRLERMAHHFRRRGRHYHAVIRRRFPKLLCIHHYEGSWAAYNPAGPYYGGFQMDAGFMERWGADELHKYGGRDARYWSPADQLAVASRAVAHIGFGSWPATAAICGLL